MKPQHPHGYQRRIVMLSGASAGDTAHDLKGAGRQGKWQALALEAPLSWLAISELIWRHRLEQARIA